MAQLEPWLDGFAFLEGPRWHDGRLWFSDMHACEVRTVDLAGTPREIATEGRHDPCICPRVVPVVEAIAALTLEDHFRRQAAMMA